MFRVVEMLPGELRARQLAATAESLIDLCGAGRRRRATTSAARRTRRSTLVEYGDFECPYCGQAETVIRELLAEFGDDLRYVWRHLPLADVHPRAQLAAEAAEAAAAQGAFWEMYDVLLDNQDELKPTSSSSTRRSSASTPTASPTSCAATSTRRASPRTSTSADRSGVSGTPTFFVNGQRHHGAYDVATLSRRRARGAQAGRRRRAGRHHPATGADDV